MKILSAWVTSILFFIFGTLPDSGLSAPNTPVTTSTISMRLLQSTANEDREFQKSLMKISFSWGELYWLPTLAVETGWPEHTHEKLAQIILRESGGCPNRRGGDKVDKNCNITGVSEWSHRSDTGLLQINGVNYDMSRNKWAPLCKEMNICSKDDQWQLLDAKTNLKAGLILYELVGWAPWDPCQWDETKCPKTKKKP